MLKCARKDGIYTFAFSNHSKYVISDGLTNSVKSRIQILEVVWYFPVEWPDPENHSKKKEGNRRKHADLLSVFLTHLQCSINCY